MLRKTTLSDPSRWSLIRRAQKPGPEQRAALGELLTYYDNLVVWLIRRRGHPPDVSTEELKQEFLEGVLRREEIDKLDPARGSFRGWLNTSIRRFLANEWKRWRTAKRGRAGTSPLEFEPLDEAALDDACTREFARQVILRTLSLQRQEARNPDRFDVIARFLPGPQMHLVELAAVAQSLGTTRNAAAKTICLARARYRELLRETIRDTLDPDPDDDPTPSGGSPRAAVVSMNGAIDDELRELRRHLLS